MTEPTNPAPPVQIPCNCAGGSCFQPGTPGCVRQETARVDAPPREAGLCDWLRAKASEMRQGEATFLDCVSAREYDDVAEIARPWEQRRIAAETRVKDLETTVAAQNLYIASCQQGYETAEAEADALRARLETAEAALRLFTCDNNKIDESDISNAVYDIASAALTHNQQPPPQNDRISVLEAALRAVREVPLDPTRINKIVDDALNVERQPAPGGGGGEAGEEQ